MVKGMHQRSDETVLVVHATRTFRGLELLNDEVAQTTRHGLQRPRQDSNLRPRD